MCALNSPMKSHSIAIHWFRRDLRLTDNTALQAASAASQHLVPCYILSSWKRNHGWTGPARQQFLCGCIQSLSKNLEASESRLILREGRAEDEIERLIKETGAQAVYFNRDYDPFGREAEKRVRERCRSFGVDCFDFQDSVMHEPANVLTGEGMPYRVFTPYSKNWLARPQRQPEGKTKLPPLPTNVKIESLPLPTLAHWSLPACTADIPTPGEKAARERMRQFIEGGGLDGYAIKRDTPSGVHTSRLGQDLRFGLISIRELVSRSLAAPSNRKSVETYVKELAWREFYMGILWHFPAVFEEEFNPDFRGMPWEGSDEAFQRWCEGRTGFPIVDAGMRQLKATGFVHNRVRMIVSMFLTKDLHCDWRLGEGFFMQHLVDGENASNNGGWQWSAGTGADAAPYFRIQNPWTQSKRHDPDGRYIREWVPELKTVPLEKLLEVPAGGRSIAPGYPLPMVDHSAERDRCLARFAKHKENVRH